MVHPYARKHTCTLCRARQFCHYGGYVHPSMETGRTAMERAQNWHSEETDAQETESKSPAKNYVG
jgi:hypothetical protein